MSRLRGKFNVLNRKPHHGSSKRDDEPASTFSNIEEFIRKRDYSGALTYLDFTSNEMSVVDKLMWEGYCYFHDGQLERAQEVYIKLLSSEVLLGHANENIMTKNVYLYLSCVYYCMHLNEEAKEAAEDGLDCQLKNRILYHLLSQETGANDKKSELLAFEQKLIDGKEDQLSHAAILFKSRKFQDAVDIYKRFLVEDRNSVALNLYIAMCYFKMDYYDVSQEVLAIYEQAQPDSIASKNLRACNNYRLYNGNAAVEEFKDMKNIDKILLKHDLIRHNMVVFTDGQKALNVLPPLVDVIVEAKLNLSIYYLRNGDIEEAEQLLDNLEPVTPQEYILLAVINAFIGQLEDDTERIRTAQTYFKAVGTSPSETDTIPGRQCMASYCFLMKLYEDSNTYLSSIKAYMADDDDFNWNYGLSLAASGDFKQAEEILLLVDNNSWKSEFCYKAWYIRCLIMNGKPKKAWEIFNSYHLDKNDTYHILNIIANDCYLKKHYYIAAKAYHAIRELDDSYDNEIFILALKGSCAGAFRDIVVNRKTPGAVQTDLKQENELKEIYQILDKMNTIEGIKTMMKTMQTWSRNNGLFI